MQKILIIEDEPELVKVIRSYLENAGFSVITAYRGDTGLTNWETNNPDLVILQFCLNDVVERYLTVARFGGDNVFLGVDTRRAGSGLFAFLLRHSRAFERFYRFSQW